MTDAEAEALMIIAFNVLQAENAKLRAALEEIATHRIDSELASREKRTIALKVLEGAAPSTTENNEKKRRRPLCGAGG
jgi:hypothetical protein